MSKIIAIVQARMNSTRFPKKVLSKINNHTLIEILLKRLSRSKLINQIILATTISQDDDLLQNHVEEIGFSVFRGDVENVLKRYYDAATKYNADIIVRITGDCPLIDSSIVDKVISLFLDNNVDYAANTYPPSFPDGLDVSVFSYQSLKEAFTNAKSDHEKEHVTPYLRNSLLFKKINLSNDIDLSKLRWTVDEYVDYKLVKNIFECFSPNIYFSFQEILKLKSEKPILFEMNNEIKRNEGSNLGKGQKLWKRAKSIIPGGNMLLSKRPEMFLPEYWPSYFSKTKGCKVWDLDGKEFIDLSLMGVGTNSLGYSNKSVDDAVIDIVKLGNMSTFNCPEEVYLSENLLELHPWADMVRLARTGGEANAMAIRIARAATGRDKVAICGYHGWHDWYLSCNLAEDKNLDGHLLPGLEPNGIPRVLKGTTLTFQYNRYDELFKLVNDNPDIGVIMMEVKRNEEPLDDYLLKVRKLTTEKGIVLIFDECTSGFRETFGGLHLKYKVNPDIAMFGKALGNGYAINAIIGRREIMEAAQSTFISSTFTTERIGPTAAIATLKMMKELKSWEIISEKGNYISKYWKSISETHGLKFKIFGLAPLIKFSIDSPNNLIYKTYITQEMLKRGFLAGNSINICTEHTEDIIKKYQENFDSLIYNISKFEKNGFKIEEILDGPICHTEFKRLN
jgi:glutamate-1-semialdehyde 2,1-aminomutase